MLNGFKIAAAVAALSTIGSVRVDAQTYPSMRPDVLGQLRLGDAARDKGLAACVGASTTCVQHVRHLHATYGLMLVMLAVGQGNDDKMGTIQGVSWTFLFSIRASMENPLR